MPSLGHIQLRVWGYSKRAPTIALKLFGYRNHKSLLNEMAMSVLCFQWALGSCFFFDICYSRPPPPSPRPRTSHTNTWHALSTRFACLGSQCIHSATPIPSASPLKHSGLSAKSTYSSRNQCGFGGHYTPLWPCDLYA